MRPGDGASEFYPLAAAAARWPSQRPRGVLRANRLEPGGGDSSPLVMRSPFRDCNSSPEVVRLTVMMDVRYPRSLRQVEDLLFERGATTGGRPGAPRPAARTFTSVASGQR